MSDILAALWQRLNPSEPSPAYLVRFMAAAVVVFVLAWLIGKALAG